MNAPLPLPLADPPAPSLPSPAGMLAGAGHAAVAGRFGALLDLARLTLEPAAVTIDARAPGPQEPVEETADAPRADALDSLLFLANVAVAAPPTGAEPEVAPKPDALHDVAPAQTAVGTPALNLLIPSASGASEAVPPTIGASAPASRSTSVAVASWSPADAGTSVAAKGGERQPVTSDIAATPPRDEVVADVASRAGAQELSNEALRNASIAAAPPPELPPALAHAAPHPTGTTHASLQATPILTIAAPLQQPQRFHEEAAAGLATLVTRGVERAELRVTPPDLGPVEVRIDVSNGEATLAIVASQPATRDALEQALPLLRDLLAAQGLTLGESSVRDERADTGSAPGGDGSSTPREGANDAGAAVSVGAGYRPHRLVDVFA